jgi:hypothetical protein
VKVVGDAGFILGELVRDLLEPKLEPTRASLAGENEMPDDEPACHSHQEQADPDQGYGQDHLLHTHTSVLAVASGASSEPVRNQQYSRSRVHKATVGPRQG